MRLQAFLDVLDGIEKNGISLTRCLELGTQWDKVLSSGLVGPLVADDFVQRPGDGDLGLLKEHISDLFDGLGKFLHQGVGLVFPVLVILLVLFNTVRSAIVDGWRSKVAKDLCDRAGFRSASLFDVDGSLRLLNSSHVRERAKELLQSILSGRWCLEWFLSGKVRGRTCAL